MIDNKVTKRIDIIKKKYDKLVSIMVSKHDTAMLIPIEKMAEGIALSDASYKCEKCGREEDLTIHHLINKNVENYCDYWKWIIQRIHWKNMLVLCEKCHRKIEGFSDTEPEVMGCIHKNKINKIKEKYKNE